MAKTTIAGVQAAMKILYPKGEMPESINEEYVFHKALKKQEDFTGEFAYVALKHANPQGIGKLVSDAQTADNSQAFKRFTLTRSKFFATARIDGEAAEAAVKTEGALVDLVEDKVSGTAQSFVHDLAVYNYGNGSGVLAQVLSIASSPTYTLTTTTNMNNLELGMTVQFVSDATLSPTLRAGGGFAITAIDRLNKTVTLAGEPTNDANGDYIVRASMASSSGTNSTYFGLESYVEGGSSPSALYGLTRTSDPVRLAGQTKSYTGEAMEDAVLDACALSAIQGIGSPDTLIANPIQVSAMKRSVGGRIVYDRTASPKAGVGFSGLVFETEAGHIDVMSDPYCPLQTAYLVRKKDWSLWSLGKAPHMEKNDGLTYLRIADDDAFEVRWKFYGALKLTNPGCQFRLTGFGA